MDEQQQTNGYEVPAPEAPPAGPTPTSWKSWVAAAGVAALTVGGAAVYLSSQGSDDTATTTAAATAGADTAAGTDSGTASAGSGGPGGFGASGEITAIDGSTLTVEATDFSGEISTITVVLDADTTVVESVEADLDALAVGDTVVVAGEEEGDTIAAASIREGDDLGGPGGGTPPDGAEGMTPPDGAEGMTPPDGAEGMTPPDGAEGMTPPDGAEGMTPPDGAELPGAFTSGEIVAIDGDTVTIETADGETVTAVVDDETTIVVTEERTAADLAVGDTIRALGETTDDTVTADSIVIGDLTGFGGMGTPPSGAPTATETEG